MFAVEEGEEEMDNDGSHAVDGAESGWRNMFENGSTGGGNIYI